MRIAWLRLLPAIILMMLSLSADAVGKEVALVYDDSGSMGVNHKWVAANYAVQIVAALGGSQDKLYLVKMSKPSHSDVFVGANKIDRLIKEFKQLKTPVDGAGTPYSSVTTALHQLINSPKNAEKWLVIMTDGAFAEQTNAQLAKDTDSAKNAKIRVIFLLIGKDHDDVAPYWERAAAAKIYRAKAADAIPEKMEEIAALLNGRSFQAGQIGVKRLTAKEFAVTSKFPLRSLIVLRQGDSDALLANATIKGVKLKQRIQQVSAVKNVEGLSTAMVGHISGSQSQVIIAGSEIKLRFDKDVKSESIKLLADVAASFTLEVIDSSGAVLTPDATGRVSWCRGKPVSVRAKLMDEAGVSITRGRNDMSSFDVGLQVQTSAKAPDIKLSYDISQEAFLQQMQISNETKVRGYAKYPGYFYFQSDPIVMLSKDCSRNLKLIVSGGLNANGGWDSEVDKLGDAPYIQLHATSDHVPIDPWAIASVQMKPIGSKSNTQAVDLDAVRVGDEWQIRPHSACCLSLRAPLLAGNYEIQFTPFKPVPGDTVDFPAPIRLQLIAPQGLWQNLWWNYCKLIILLVTILLLWYLWRLRSKARFKKSACIWYQVGGVGRPILKGKLRGGWVIRWLWPSVKERARVAGLRVEAARGESIIIDGKTLGENHVIAGWVYMPRKKTQPNAKVYNKSEFTRSTAGSRGVIAERYYYSSSGGPFPKAWK